MYPWHEFENHKFMYATRSLVEFHELVSPVMQSFGIFFVGSLNKLLNK